MTQLVMNIKKKDRVMALPVEKSNEIGKKLLLEMMKQEKSLPSKEKINRDMPNVAKKLGLNATELIEFVHEIMPELIAYHIGAKKVTIEW